MRTEVPAPTPGPPVGRIRSALERLSLRSLLVGSAGLVFLFCVLVVVLLEVGRSRTLRLVDTLINVEDVVADLCLSSAAAMNDARRQEKDFALSHREFGFDESRSRYFTRVLTDVAEIGENMARIRAVTGDPETAHLTREIETALARYRGGVETWVDKHGERGSFEVGVEGELRVEAHEMERLVRERGSASLLVQLLEVQRAEKDYLERTRDTDVVALRAGLGEFTAAAAGLNAATSGKLQRHADRYLGLFERYVQLTGEIREVKRGYLRAVQQIEPLLEKLHVASDERVAAQRSAYAASTRLLRLPILVVGGLALTLTALVALAISIAVARSVVESRTFAERIASGDLRSRLVPAGGVEFRSLANALNSMAESLQAADLARRQQEAALRESEEKYRAFVETSNDWIWAIDRDGRHIFSNERVKEILGFTPGELIGKHPPDLLHPDDIPRVGDLLAASVAAGTGWQGVVLRWRHRDGAWRWLESSAVPILDDRGAAAGFRGVDRDVTERRRMEEELVKAQKLEAIGTLAGGIAHDFNNLLQGLFGYISLAKAEIDQPDRALGMLDQAEKALELSLNLTTQLLTFSKGGKPLMKRVALPEILEDPVKFALSGSNSDYRIALDPDLPPVEADAGQLAQVIQNLVLNASEAMPQGGTVQIAAHTAIVAPGSNPIVPAGGTFARIDVKDSGVGIPGQHLAQIFDPYFSTKQRGSGLGLATSYSIVRNHGGFIDVASRPGAGTIFSVYLPASAGETAPAPVPTHRSDGVGTSRLSVLLMDDEDLVRSVAGSMFAALGHAVITAANGEEALEAFRQAQLEGRPFDVVILDLTVKKGMGGEETIRRLLELDPSIKAVVSSGYSDASVVADYRSHGFAWSLNKPYRLDALRTCLATLTGPPAGDVPGEPREGAGKTTS